MARRTPFRNNAPLVLAVTAIALTVFLAVEALLRKSRDFSPDFLASVLLYGLTVLNLTLLLVLCFVLGRNIVRVLMERRRGAAGVRLRLRLLLVFVLMAGGPAVLLIVVGSDVIQHTVDRWFSVDVERILSSSQALGTAMREAVAERCRAEARVLARELETAGLLEVERQPRLRRAIETRARELRADIVNVFVPSGELVAVMDPRLPPAPHDPEPVLSLARAALAGREAEATVPYGAGELVRVAVPVSSRSGRVLGSVVLSRFLTPGVVAEAREVQDRYLKFRRVQASREPIKAVYLSLYLFPALLILFGAVWLALYLSRRITTPLRLVAEATERIASGERGVRVDFPTGDDEFSALIASFNRMSERLARSEEEVRHSRDGLFRKNRELEERRLLMETVLETVGTGVVVVDAEGTTTVVNAAACRLLDIDASAVGRLLEESLRGPGLEEIQVLVQRLLSGRGRRQEREIMVPWGGRERRLAVTVVPLPGPPGAAPGAVVVLDDLTPLMRAQKIAAWGEVARKLAHEIKNPLTPIQLSAQRIRRAYVKSAPDLESIVTTCTTAIVDEVEALRNLVDEFSQFARWPAAHLVPSSPSDIVDQALSLYEGLFPDVQLTKRLAADLPLVRLDAAQIKRALLNLIDNAIDATDRKGRVEVAAELDRAQGCLRLVVSDDGVGIAAADRDRLFVPHFSTKRRGSGLGLSIVSRIVQEHNGTIRVEDALPRGTRFIIEVPA